MSPTITSIATEIAFVDVPEMLASKATILYVGFTPAKADELWNRWTNWNADDGIGREIDEGAMLQITFEEVLTGHIGGTGPNSLDTFSDDDGEWHRCLDSYGLAKETQDAIMAPAFAYLRRTQSCAFWARDTVAMRYAGLEEMQLTSLERQAQLQRAAGAASTGASQSASPTEMAGDATSVRTAIESAARNAPGHTLLFKSLDLARSSRLFDGSGRVQDFTALHSKPPTDFSRFTTMYYFTPQFAVAERSAAYAKNRAVCEAVVVIAISVPNAAIEALKPPAIQHLFWGANWTKMVWHSRGEHGRLPTALRKYSEAIVIIGHVAGDPDLVYKGMQSPQQIAEDSVLRVEGPGGATKAAQYVFADSDEGAQWLWDNGAQTLRAFVFSTRDLEQWTWSLWDDRARCDLAFFPAGELQGA